MLKISETAGKKLAEILSQQPEPVYGLRVSFQSGGCGCHPYSMSLATEAGPSDWVGDYGGVKVLVDPESAREIEGVRIDYVETVQASGFTISKPDAQRGCGCRGEQSEGKAEGGGCCGGNG
jgi:iron-sulfur cluster assembly accessory protein